MLLHAKDYTVGDDCHKNHVLERREHTVKEHNWHFEKSIKDKVYCCFSLYHTSAQKK